MSRITRLLEAGDNFINALFGGNPDSSISARTAFNRQRSHDQTYWIRLARIIDWAFYPIDGHGHCTQAWQNDPSEDYQDANTLDRLGLALLVYPFCLILGLILRIRA